MDNIDHLYAALQAIKIQVARVEFDINRCEMNLAVLNETIKRAPNEKALADLVNTGGELLRHLKEYDKQRSDLREQIATISNTILSRIDREQH